MSLYVVAAAATASLFKRSERASPREAALHNAYKMSSEVCPFCGKAYKRLKSHLPHCKAAAGSKTPPTKHEVTVNQTSSSQLATASPGPTAKGEKSTQMLSVTARPQSKKSEKVSAVSPAPLQSSSPATSSSQSLSQSSASLPPSTKKKKPKLSEQIKAANMSSNTIPLLSTPSLPLSLSPTVSEPKEKSLRALIEAAKSKQVSKGSPEGTRSAAEDLPSGSTPLVADPLCSRTTAQPKTKTNPEQDLVKDNAQPAFLPADTKLKRASKMKASKTKKAAQPLSTTKNTSSSLDSKVNGSNARRGHFWVDNEGEIEDLSGNKMLLKSRSGYMARITLQDVKATLGRANTTRQSSRKSILCQFETTDDLSGKIRPGTSLTPVQPPPGNQAEVDSCLVTTKTPSDQLASTSSQHTEQQSVKGGSQVSQATSPPHTVSMNEGLKVGHHMTGLQTILPSLARFSSPHLFLLAPQTLPAKVETLRAADGLMMEKSQLEARKQISADHETRVWQSLGQVRLRELPEWLVCKTPSHPRDVVEIVQRGWQWYYKRYIDVKKGGVGGLGMLLAGYCVLSYIWSYPRIKRDRWRKYH